MQDVILPTRDVTVRQTVKTNMFVLRARQTCFLPSWTFPFSVGNNQLITVLIISLHWDKCWEGEVQFSLITGPILTVPERLSLGSDI